MIGTRLANRFEIVRELGRGGMGVVYLARDPMLERDIAIKLVSPHLLTGEAVERFKREARVVARMDHPGIVGVHDIGEHEESLFFVMAYVPGVSLRSLIDSRSMSVGEMLDIGAQVAEALEYSHAMGVIHRDVKPENILVERQEGAIGGLRARVTDFGLARTAEDQRITHSGSFVGTIAYLSPEQVASREVDARSDVYSLGVILYECLAGRPPFSGEIHSVLFQIVSEIAPTLREAGAQVDDDLELFVMRCLEKDPAMRPQKARDMAEGLRRLEHTLRESERGRVLQTSQKGMTGHRAVVPAFVAREKEFGELQQRLSLAVSGECQFVVISGDPGAGKSRLLDELEKFAKARDIRVLHGRFVEQETSFPYQSFCEVIQEYLHRTPSTRTSAPADFSDLATDLISLFPVLAEEFSGTHKISSESTRIQDRTYVFDLLARSFLRIGGGKPLVILFEDLHHGDVSLEALQYIIRRLSPTPVLVAATYRSTEVDKHHPLSRMLSGFFGDKRFLRIQVSPFNSAEHRLFLKNLLGSDDIEKDFAQNLFEATEGNPHFTRELIRSLMDAGRIEKRETGSWSLSGEGFVSSESLPPTIQQAVEKRIERLPEDWVEALSLASILGRAFDYRDLESLAEEKSIEGLIDKLIEGGFLEEERGTRSDQLLFSSGVIRDVLYARVPRRRRRSLHRKFGELLEKRYAGRLDRIYPQLVHHFAQGDVAEKVIEYGMTFARKSLAAFSAEEAIYAGKAVLEFLVEEGTATPLLGELRMLMAEACKIKGDFDAALEESEAAIRIFERCSLPEQSARALVLAAETAWEGRRVEPARRLLEKGLELLKEADAPLRMRLLSLGATLSNLRGEYDRATFYLNEMDRMRPAAVAPPQETLPGGGTLTAPLSLPMAQHHPAAMRTTDEGEVAGCVFETLLRTDDQGRLVPELCTSWEESGHGAMFVFTLRSGVRLHNGELMTASLVKGAMEASIRLAGKRLPVAFGPIRGVTEFQKEEKPDVEGIEARNENTLVISLTEPLPIYPALLSDPSASIAMDKAGTGPFAYETFRPDFVRLARNENYWREPPLLDAIEFQCGVNSTDAAAGFRAGRFDVVGNLPLRDFEQLLQERRLRAGVLETIRGSIYFVIFNEQGPAASNPKVRQAMAGVVRIADLVRSTLGRLAQPAEGLFGPGMLGHNPGRRRPTLLREKAIEMLQSTGMHPPVRMKAAVHPIFLDRYEAFLKGLLKMWTDMGIEVSIATSTMQEYLDGEVRNEDLDLIIGRWIPDYDDPDGVASSIFRTPNGIMCRYYSAPELDQRIDHARAESNLEERGKSYQRIEDMLAESGCFLPLFYEIDYRLFHQRLRGITLHSRPPFLNYSQLARLEATETYTIRKLGGTLVVPISGDIPGLDPSQTITAWQQEVNPAIFETLTRTGEGATIVPFLAAEFHSEQGGRSYFFRLRENIRFHDGRVLSARDVRYSFEHLLSSTNLITNWLLSPILGATEILQGTARDLKGFHIISPLEFRIELEQPIAFFPALLAFTPASVVPEGSEHFQGSWRDGCVGTGPFRVVRFDSGNRIELEANPHYWQEGLPRAESLQFHLKVPPHEMVEGLKEGRYSLVWDLLPAEAEELRLDPEYASGFRVTPSHSTYMLVCNTKQGPLADPALRQRIAQGIEVDSLVRRYAGRLAIPAHGLIPPGLLGYDPNRRRQSGSGSYTAARSGDGIEIRCLMHSIYESTYAPFAQEVLETLRRLGFHPVVVEKKSEYAGIAQYAQKADLNLTRWIADYPDADAFSYSMLHSEKGLHGAFCGSPELDALIERGRSEYNSDSRHQIYRRFEDFVARHTLILPFFHEQTYRFVRPEIDEFEYRSNYPTVAYEKLRVKL